MPQRFNTLGDVMKAESITTIGEAEYQKIYSAINDTLRTWMESDLYSARKLKIDDWQVDSLLCINREANKLITTVLYRSTFWDDTEFDDLKDLNGVKINGSWYFFWGGNQPIYQHKTKKGGTEIRTPNTFEELHELAVEHVYRGYLRRTADGDYVINDAFFENTGCTDSPRPGYCQCKTCETFEDWVLYTIKENWQRRDMTDWEQLRRDERSKS